jgi:diguanylate cyclase (GGDEF)-like protein
MQPDFLTGLFNRRGFFLRATEAISEVPREATLSAVMFDLDHFKHVNDKYGHEAGDRALTAKLRSLRGSMTSAAGWAAKSFACWRVMGRPARWRSPKT